MWLGTSQAAPGYVLSRQTPPTSSARSMIVKSSRPAPLSLAPMASPLNPAPDDDDVLQCLSHSLLHNRNLRICNMTCITRLAAPERRAQLLDAAKEIVAATASTPCPSRPSPAGRASPARSSTTTSREGWTTSSSHWSSGRRDARSSSWPAWSAARACSPPSRPISRQWRPTPSPGGSCSSRRGVAGGAARPGGRVARALRRRDRRGERDRGPRPRAHRPHPAGARRRRRPSAAGRLRPRAHPRARGVGAPALAG